MRVIPIVLDDRPAYLGSGDLATSLLLLPCGDDVLLCEVLDAVAEVTPAAPYVLPRFTAGTRYRAALAETGRHVAGVLSTNTLRDPLAHFDQSDMLLLVAADAYPVEGLDLTRLAEGRRLDARIVRHLLAFEAAADGTREFVQAGADGRIRRIQRYFASVSWPFPAGIVASIVPVSCFLAAPDAATTGLAELRAQMSAAGIPSQDVPYPVHLLHLSDETGALSLAERRARDLVDEAGAALRTVRGPLALDPDVDVHPTARFLGPVVLARGSRVEAEALVVGPTLIGLNATVGRGATVAQCLVVGGAQVPPEMHARHRVLIGGAESERARVPQRRLSRAATPDTTSVAQGPGIYPRVKSVIEPLLAIGALIVLSPVLALIALCVFVDSGLPLFYGDPREGRAGVPFRCWKFRSMRADADALQRALLEAQGLDGPQFKMKHDPRVTRVGRWLRRLNVDELPQLWNVVRGEMSFVGPRPSPFRENQICVPWRNGRLSVHPGVTGLWQVCRHDRESGDFHQWIHYDLLYVRHQSLALDLRIMSATLRTLGGRRPTALDRLLPDVHGHTPRRDSVRVAASRTPVATTSAGAAHIGSHPNGGQLASAAIAGRT